MKRKNIKTILTSVIIAIVSFFYFWGLSYFGERYHQTKIHNQPSERKSDTLLTKGWKFHLGDNPDWAKKSFNDSNWANIPKQTIDLDSLPSYNGKLGWFRLKLKIDSSFSKDMCVLIMKHYGASEIFLDGEKIASFGKVAAEKENEKNIDPEIFPINVQFGNTSSHLIAVRYSNLNCSNYMGFQHVPGFNLKLRKAKASLNDTINTIISNIGSCAIGIFLLTISFLHFLLFLFYRKAKENIFYSLFAFFYSLLFFISMLHNSGTTNPFLELFSDTALEIDVPLLMLALLLFVQRVYQRPLKKWLWLLAIIPAAVPILDSFTDWIPQFYIIFCMIWLFMFAMSTMISGTLKVLRKKIPGAKILGAGIGTFALFIFCAISAIFFSQNISISNLWIVLVVLLAMMSIPISMSIYLAYSFSTTSKSLQKKLIEVEDLSAKTISQEKEKQEILSKQKEKLEIQVAERTKEISEQKKLIEEKNKDITDSINYAKRIQDAILPSDEQIKKFLPESFVLFKPKDIVSGDFYFFSHTNDKIIAAAVDCTGHGVPGAFMSMIGHDLLQNIIDERKITDTSKILDELHKQVLLALNRDITNRDSKDGMDAAILCIDNAKREVQYSGAVRPLYYFDSRGFHEVKGERYSIAGVKEIGSTPFASTIIPVTEPTNFYIFSDGFADQFGGADGKKLMSKYFRELITSLQGKNMQEQKNHLDKFLQEWKAGREQMDDIMIIGIKIS